MQGFATQAAQALRISAGTQSAFRGTVVFSNSNSISFGMDGSVLTASAALNGAGGPAISAGTNSMSNTDSTITFLSLAVLGAAELDFGISGRTVTASAMSVVPQFLVSTEGNTSGDTGSKVGSCVLEASGFCTWSQITAAGQVTGRLRGKAPGITQISAGTTKVGTGAEGISFADSNNWSWGINGSTMTADIAAIDGCGVSTGGNTAGNTGLQTTPTVLVATGSLTLSQSTNSNGITVTFDGGITGTNIIAISAGTQSVSTGTVVFSNSNGVTFGMSGSTRITASFSGGGGDPNLSVYGWDDKWQNVGQTYSSDQLMVQPLWFPGNMTCTRLNFIADGQLQVGGVGITHTMRAGIYTLSGSTASLASSMTITASTHQDSIGEWANIRWRSVTVGSWQFTRGAYLFAWQHPSDTQMHFSYYGNSSASIAGNYTGTGSPVDVWMEGVMVTASLPSSIHISNIVHTGESQIAQPGVVFAGTI